MMQTGRIAPGSGANRSFPDITDGEELIAVERNTPSFRTVIQLFVLGQMRDN